jgi:hypothetical protein
MLDPRRDGLDPGGFEAADHLLRREGGGEVEIAGILVEQQVADRSADEADGARLGIESLQQALDAGAVEPGGGLQLHPIRRVRLTSIAAVAPQMRRPCQSIW